MRSPLIFLPFAKCRWPRASKIFKIYHIFSLVDKNFVAYVGMIQKLTIVLVAKNRLIWPVLFVDVASFRVDLGSILTSFRNPSKGVFVSSWKKLSPCAKSISAFVEKELNQMTPFVQVQYSLGKIDEVNGYDPVGSNLFVTLETRQQNLRLQ